jgi:hypothetical protein
MKKHLHVHVHPLPSSRPHKSRLFTDAVSCPPPALRLHSHPRPHISRVSMSCPPPALCLHSPRPHISRVSMSCPPHLLPCACTPPVHTCLASPCRVHLLPCACTPPSSTQVSPVRNRCLSSTSCLLSAARTAGESGSAPGGCQSGPSRGCVPGHRCRPQGGCNAHVFVFSWGLSSATRNPEGILSHNNRKS